MYITIKTLLAAGNSQRGIAKELGISRKTVKRIRCRYRKIRRRAKGRPDPELYNVRKEALALLEQQSVVGHIDLFYGVVPTGMSLRSMRKAICPMDDKSQVKM